jgi:hypothetical protein
VSLQKAFILELLLSPEHRLFSQLSNFLHEYMYSSLVSQSVIHEYIQSLAILHNGLTSELPDETSLS